MPVVRLQSVRLRLIYTCETRIRRRRSTPLRVFECTSFYFFHFGSLRFFPYSSFSPLARMHRIQVEKSATGKPGTRALAQVLELCDRPAPPPPFPFLVTPLFSRFADFNDTTMTFVPSWVEEKENTYTLFFFDSRRLSRFLEI